MKYIAILVLLAVSILPAFGVSSYLGPTGNIATPDALVVPLNTWELGYHQFVEVFGGADFITTSVNYGLAPNLEVGGAFTSNGSSEFVFNGKYQFLAETEAIPALAVGVFDAASTLDIFGDDPGFYLVATKNIGPTTPIVGEPFRATRLSIGIGSGVFDGFFANLDWALSERSHLLFEFINNDFAREGSGGSNFNAGIRYGLTETITLDAALIDFEDLAFGASIRTSF